MEWKDYSRKDFHYYVGANLTYIKTKVVENGEGYKPWSYLSGKGLAIGQIFGLEAIGYSAMRQILRIVRSNNFRRYARGM